MQDNIDKTNCSVVVAAGISFGLSKGLNNIRPVKGAGCGNVVGDCIENQATKTNPSCEGGPFVLNTRKAVF
jgi:hypothetical protein